MVRARVPNMGWIRAIVLSIKKEHAQIYMCDIGHDTVLCLDFLQPLSPSSKVLPHFAQAFYIRDVIAAGGGNWTQTAKDFTMEWMVESKVEVTVLGPGMLNKNHPYLSFYSAH